MRLSLNSITPRWFKRLNHYLLTHHAVLWETKVHYFALLWIFGVAVSILFASYMGSIFTTIPNRSNINLISCFLQVPCYIFFVIYLSKQIKFIKNFPSKDYIKAIFIYGLIAFFISLLFLVSLFTYFQKFISEKNFNKEIEKVIRTDYYLNLYENLKEVEVYVEKSKDKFAFKYEKSFDIDYLINTEKGHKILLKKDDAYDYIRREFVDISMNMSVDSIVVVDSVAIAVDTVATTPTDYKSIVKDSTDNGTSIKETKTISTAELLDKWDMFNNYIKEFNIFFSKNCVYFDSKRDIQYLPIKNKTELNELKLLYYKYAFLDNRDAYIHFRDIYYIFGYYDYINDNENERKMKISKMIPPLLLTQEFHHYLIEKDPEIRIYNFEINDYRKNYKSDIESITSGYKSLKSIKEFDKYHIINIYLFIFYVMTIVIFLVLTFHNTKKFILLTILSFFIILFIPFIIIYDEVNFLSHIYPKTFFHSNLFHFFLYSIIFMLLMTRKKRKKYDIFFYWLCFLTYFINSISIIFYVLEEPYTYDHQKFYLDYLLLLGVGGVLVVFFTNAIIMGKFAKLPQK